MSKLITQNDLKKILDNVLPVDEDSGWINMELTSTFLPYASTSINAYRKVGNVVTIVGELKPAANIAASNTPYNICTLPEGYRPKTLITSIMQGTDASEWLLTINPNGVVQFARYRSGGSFVQCTTAYWLPFYATFLVAEANPKTGPDAGDEINVDDFTEEELDDFVDGLDITGIHAVDYVVDQGTSGNWTYKKWNSGNVELWGRFSQTQSAYTTNGFIVGSASITAYPFTITNPITQATCEKIGTGGGVITFDYCRTDYWNGIAVGVNQSPASGTSMTIIWTVSVKAKWK